jgi:hypothetical protein
VRERYFGTVRAFISMLLRLLRYSVEVAGSTGSGALGTRRLTARGPRSPYTLTRRRDAATPTDPAAASVTSGAMRKKRGVKPEVHDILVLYRGKLIAIELKSRRGQCKPSQRAVREALLHAGAQWWVCRSATIRSNGYAPGSNY